MGILIAGSRPGNSDSEIRRAFAVFSQSAVCIGGAQLGGFSN
jgi:hypothetical protein